MNALMLSNLRISLAMSNLILCPIVTDVLPPWFPWEDYWVYWFGLWP